MLEGLSCTTPRLSSSLLGYIKLKLHITPCTVVNGLEAIHHLLEFEIIEELLKESSVFPKPLNILKQRSSFRPGQLVKDPVHYFF